MSAPPPVLPFSGDWQTYLDAIYGYYVAEVVRSTTYIQGKPVKARFNPATQGKGFSFWHVISEGKNEADRVPDLRRCERIRWIAWMLDRAASGDSDLLSWKSLRTQKRGTREHSVFYCEANSYVVILEEKDGYFLLVTAYPVTGGRAAKLRKEWEDTKK